ncbi:MAG: type VI secretion system-associated protein TagF [Variovorax sp.]
MSALAQPGWFGKLPGIGDFAHRRLPETFRAQWDAWLQSGLVKLRERHEDWVERYLDGPLWFFVLGEQVAGPRAWLGVLMPSVDGVGRYFPFTLAVELEFPTGAPPDDANALLQHWWARAAQAALEGLEQDLDAVGFDALLDRIFRNEAAAPDSAEPVHLPLAGQSHWYTEPATPIGLRMTASGLPRERQFEALFGFTVVSNQEGA